MVSWSQNYVRALGALSFSGGIIRGAGWAKCLVAMMAKRSLVSERMQFANDPKP